MKRRRIDAGDVLEGAASALNLWAQVGLISGASLAAVFGQFLLSLLLLAIAAGLFLRVWRRKRRPADRP